MRDINTLIVHCSATYKNMDIGVAEIRDWHIKENGWADIGYHYVIRRDGETENARPIDIAGAHAKGHNHDSIGICLIGGIDDKNKPEFNFTFSQITSLMQLIDRLKVGRPWLDVIGHNKVSDKACPVFDVAALYNGGAM